MRFSYEPNEGTLSAYVKKSEFDLAVKDDEYRVFQRKFNPEKLKDFIQDYSGFMKRVFESLIPNEEMYDIVALSTYKKTYVWKSLLHLEYSVEHESFMENMLGYAMFMIEKEIKSLNQAKSLDTTICPEDAVRLSMILNLLDFKSLPEPFTKKKSGSKKRNEERQLKEINLKISKFEKKYGFSSEELIKFYSTDEFLEEPMKDWLELCRDRDYVLQSKSRQLLIEDFIKQWKSKIQM